MNLLVFASGRGSNFKALIDASRSGFLSAKIVGLICDKECPAVKISSDNSIEHSIVSPSSFPDKKTYIDSLINTVKKYSPDYIALAGYMRMIPSELIDLYPLRILNVHPSFLPEFPGKDSIKRAWTDKVSSTGVTVHYVNDRMDQGPIIEQVRVEVPGSLDELEIKIHEVEHKIYPSVIKSISEESPDTLVVSRCLLGVNCRYDGSNKFSERVKRFVDIFKGRVIDVCPEVDSGLSIPRNRINIKDDLAIMEGNKKDLTSILVSTSNNVLSTLSDKNKVMAILKKGSPSCGIANPLGIFTRELKLKMGKRAFIVSEEDL